MKKFLFSTALLISIFTINAQEYSSALGFRGSHSYGGITYKWFHSGLDAIDLTFSSDFNSGLTVTGLYERHVSVEGVPSLYWYYGAGAHLGLYGSGNNAVVNFGPDGVVGLEYVVKEIPFAFSLDYIPSFNIAIREGENTAGFYFSNWSFGVKYTFGARIHDEKLN